MNKKYTYYKTIDIFGNEHIFVNRNSPYQSKKEQFENYEAFVEKFKPKKLPTIV